jgi:hypothetical protein
MKATISISLKARLEAHVIVVTLLLCVSLVSALSITVLMPIMVQLNPQLN